MFFLVIYHLVATVVCPSAMISLRFLILDLSSCVLGKYSNRSLILLTPYCARSCMYLALVCSCFWRDIGGRL